MKTKEIQKIIAEVQTNPGNWRQDKSYRILEMLSQLQERLEYINDRQYSIEYNIQLRIKDAIFMEFCNLIRENQALRNEIVRDDGK